MNRRRLRQKAPLRGNISGCSHGPRHCTCGLTRLLICALPTQLPTRLSAARSLPRRQPCCLPHSCAPLPPSAARVPYLLTQLPLHQLGECTHGHSHSRSHGHSHSDGHSLAAAQPGTKTQPTQPRLTPVQPLVSLFCLDCGATPSRPPRGVLQSPSRARGALCNTDRAVS